jgi:hypothetical protein
MNPGNTLTMSARLDIERIELFIPEPIEAWMLADFADIELGVRDGDDVE